MAALLSKENAASLPLALMLTEWALYGGAGLARRALRLMPYALLVLLIPLSWRLGASALERARLGGSFAAQAATLVQRMLFRANPHGDLSPIDYLLTQCVVIPRYLALVVLPWGFNVDHDVALQRALSAPVAGGLVLLAALAGFGLYAIRRWPVTGFGIFWCFVTLSVESSLLPLSDVMMEHRMYLAMPGIALAVGSGFAWAFRRYRLPAVVVGGLAAVGLACLTAARNEVWRTPVSLWSAAVAGSPLKARPHVNLGLALLSDGQYDAALQQYCRALALDPENPTARTNLDVALEEHAEHRIAVDEEIELEGAAIGPDGTITLEPPDPCRDR